MKVQRNVQLLQVERTFSSLALCPEFGSKIATEQSNNHLSARILVFTLLKTSPPSTCAWQQAHNSNQLLINLVMI